MYIYTHTNLHLTSGVCVCVFVIIYSTYIVMDSISAVKAAVCGLVVATRRHHVCVFAGFVSGGDPAAET